MLGASFWGVTADFIGRKPAFTSTILLGGVFACAVAGAQDFVTFCALWGVIGTATGGNVPVDSILFLEFVPQEKQWLLTSLSAWWNLGQVIVALVAWVFLANYACEADEAPCKAGDNMGWRYTMITLGALALAFAAIRIFVFKMPESPRYLLSRGRDAEAVEAVNYIARYNGRPETLTLDMLQAIDDGRVVQQSDGSGGSGGGGSDQAAEKTATTTTTMTATRRSYGETMRASFQNYSSHSFKKLFAGRKMAQHSSFTFLIWFTIGMSLFSY